MNYEWELNILTCFVELGGRAWNHQIYFALEKSMKLESRHLWSQLGNRPAFQNQVRSHISDLCKKTPPELRMIRRGLHEITEAGRARVPTGRKLRRGQTS